MIIVLPPVPFIRIDPAGSDFSPSQTEESIAWKNVLFSMELKFYITGIFRGACGSGGSVKGVDSAELLPLSSSETFMNG